MSHCSRLRAAIAVVLTASSPLIAAQTTAGIGTTIVFPVTAQTTSFASELTLFNPGPSALTASVKFYEANNSATPGLKTCSDVTIAAARSAQIKLSTQCTLTAASHFGLLILADKASPQSNNFYGYVRVQNPQGIGFSVEGFPVQNFNNQVAEATGLMKQAAAPGYQTNCFVGSLDLPVSYTLKLFNGFTGSQIGGTLAGSLTAYQQIRYLDIFGSSGVNATAGDQFNVRAEFTQTAGGAGNLIGFCTVQDNTSFGADFRVAKSYGSPSGSFFAQGGNAFGATATLGTNDNNVLHVLVGGQRAIRIEPSGDAVNFPGAVNIIGGHASNQSDAGNAGATIAGGGASGAPNLVTSAFGTIGGGVSNTAGNYAAVAGGLLNSATGYSSAVAGGAASNATGAESAVAGGFSNTASGTDSFVAGGQSNVASGAYSLAAGEGATASGEDSFAAGRGANANQDGCFVWGDDSTGNAVSCIAPNRFVVRSEGGIFLFAGNDGTNSDNHYTGVYLPSGAQAWSVASDRNGKEGVLAVEPREVLRKVVTMPIATWYWKSQDHAIRHMGPMAQDFSAAFGLGDSPKAISTVDADGVALAAIQGLHELIVQKDGQIEAMQQRIAALEAQLNRVDALAEELTTLKAAIAQSRGAHDSVATR